MNRTLHKYEKSLSLINPSLNTKLFPWKHNSSSLQHPHARHTLLSNISLSKGQSIAIEPIEICKEPLKTRLLGQRNYFSIGCVDRRKKWEKSHTIMKRPKKMELYPASAKYWDGMELMVHKGGGTLKFSPPYPNIWNKEQVTSFPP